jgi:sodium/bile acid cotransporter 7
MQPPSSLPSAAAQRWKIPLSESDIIASASSLGMVVPDTCLPGVTANLVLLERHAELLGHGDLSCG